PVQAVLFQKVSPPFLAGNKCVPQGGTPAVFEPWRAGQGRVGVGPRKAGPFGPKGRQVARPVSRGPARCAARPGRHPPPHPGGRRTASLSGRCCASSLILLITRML